MRIEAYLFPPCKRTPFKLLLKSLVVRPFLSMNLNPWFNHLMQCGWTIEEQYHLCFSRTLRSVRISFGTPSIHSAILSLNLRPLLFSSSRVNVCTWPDRDCPGRFFFVTNFLFNILNARPHGSFYSSMLALRSSISREAQDHPSNGCISIVLQGIYSAGQTTYRFTSTWSSWCAYTPNLTSSSHKVLSSLYSTKLMNEPGFIDMFSKFVFAALYSRRGVFLCCPWSHTSVNFVL